MHLEICSHTPKTPKKGAPKLLFVHGICVGAWVWEENILPYFAKNGYEAHALSLRGHGGSDGKEHLQSWTLADYANDVEQAVQRLGGDVVVVGHSLGGAVVQKWLHGGVSRKQAVGAALLASVPPWGLMISATYMGMFSPLLSAEISRMLFSGAAGVDPKMMRRALFSDRMDEDKSTAWVRRIQDESLSASVETQGWVVPMYQRPAEELPIFVAGAADDKFIPRGEVRSTAFYYQTTPVIVTNLAHAVMLDTHWQHMAKKLLNWVEAL